MHKQRNGTGVQKMPNGSTRSIEDAAVRRGAHEVDMDQLLKELHEKKRWLDTMIVGLEKAVRSPHHQLIETAARVFDDLEGNRPKVDLLPRTQRKLAELALQVGKVRRRRSAAQEAA